jgi:hypothetical protein
MNYEQCTNITKECLKYFYHLKKYYYIRTMCVCIQFIRINAM